MLLFVFVKEAFSFSFLSCERVGERFNHVGICRAFENMRDMRYMRDICDMLHGGTCFCILLIYPIYRAKYNKYQV